MDIIKVKAYGHYNLGYAYFLQGRLNEAIIELNTSIAQNPNYIQAYGTLSQIYQKLGKPQEAAKYRQKVQELGG